MVSDSERVAAMLQSPAAKAATRHAESGKRLKDECSCLKERCKSNSPKAELSSAAGSGVDVESSRVHGPQEWLTWGIRGVS